MNSFGLLSWDFWTPLINILHCRDFFFFFLFFKRLFSRSNWLKQNFLMQFWNLFVNESAWKMDAGLLKWKYVLWCLKFFCQCYRTLVSADKFSRMPLFHLFYPKTVSNAHFKAVFCILGGLTEQRWSQFDFPF